MTEPAPSSPRLRVAPAAGLVALRIGAHAARALAEPGPVHVFARAGACAYLGVGPRAASTVCIGGPAIGLGPLHLLVSADTLPASWIPGCSGWSGAQVLGLGGLRIDHSGCRVWAPAPHAAAPCAVQRERLLRLLAADPAGLGLQAGLAAPLVAALRSRGRQAVAALDGWVRTAPPTAVPTAVLALLGLGPGLTPSGDDFLIGVLMTLDAAGRTRHRDCLARRLEHDAAGRTGRVSCAHLRAAAQGAARSEVHTLLARLADPGAPLLRAVAELLCVGGSSGRDCLAGIAATLAALRPTGVEGERPIGSAGPRGRSG